MKQDRIPMEVEAVWDEFHKVVNMTGEELRSWLLTDASGEEALPPDPGMRLSELGRHVVRILGKRKVDLTSDDADTMASVVDYVNGKIASAPADAEQDERWRRSLMTVGHDPLKPS